jgi:hypothetical protein
MDFESFELDPETLDIDSETLEMIWHHTWLLADFTDRCLAELTSLVNVGITKQRRAEILNEMENIPLEGLGEETKEAWDSALESARDYLYRLPTLNPGVSSDGENRGNPDSKPKMSPGPSTGGPTVEEPMAEE